MAANCNCRERKETTKRRYGDGMEGSLAVDCSNCRVRNGGRGEGGGGKLRLWAAQARIGGRQ